MFDMNSINKRYWDVKLIFDTDEKDGTGETSEMFLSVECPKLKTLRKITELAKDKEKLVENLCSAMSLALSKNKQCKQITADFIEEKFDIDDINALLTSYFEWVKGVKNSPN
jgi:nitrate/nitrite-specific signal transduction histidine kinase